MPGDEVQVRRESPNNMDTPFFPQPYIVVSRQGSKVTVQLPGGVKYDRNTSYVEKCLCYDSPGTLQTEAEKVGDQTQDGTN